MHPGLARLLAFLDSDVPPAPGGLTPLLAHLADPTVALVAPRIVALPPAGGWTALPPVRGRLGRYEAVRSSLDLGPDPAAVVPRSRVAHVPGAALLVRRGAVGTGFDEAVRAAEDVDLVLRLPAAGWRLRYEPSSRVAHEHRTALRAWWLRKACYGTGAAPLAVRRDPRVRPGPLGQVVAHRLGDLAHGTGLWRGALRHRTFAPSVRRGRRLPRPGSGIPRPAERKGRR